MRTAENWVYTGHLIDLEYPQETCEWCGKTGLRYQFEIINKKSNETILVGSECIKKFGIDVLNEFGDRLDIKYASKKLNNDKNELIKQNRIARVISSILELQKIDEIMNYDDMIEYYKEREAYTPSQLQMLYWRFDVNKIEYNKKDYKIILKRNREKNQLLEMAEWKIRKIWDSMSHSQKDWYEENK